MPVIVVGNITVGGVGKTPLVIELVNLLQAKDYKVGVVSRAYGVSLSGVTIVSDDHQAKDVGDEPLLIYQKTKAPVAVAKVRSDAVEGFF